jgi:flagellar protein FlaF
MAVGDLIGAAVGVILLVIVAYLLVGAVVSTAQIVTSAQKSATLLEENQLKTDFSITNATMTGTSDFMCTIDNTGNVPISDFTHMDVIVYDSNSNTYNLYPYSTSSQSTGTWTIVSQGNDVIHGSELYPGNAYIIEVMTTGTSPYWFQITTANGVYASAFLS